MKFQSFQTLPENLPIHHKIFLATFKMQYNMTQKFSNIDFERNKFLKNNKQIILRFLKFFLDYFAIFLYFFVQFAFAFLIIYGLCWIFSFTRFPVIIISIILSIALSAYSCFKIVQVQVCKKADLFYDML